MMPVFWLSIVCMLGAALLVVLRPLFRRSLSRNVDFNAAQVDIYHNRLLEMEAEVVSGVLSAVDAEAARTELARNLLQETEARSDAAVATRGVATRHWWAAGRGS